MSAHAMLGAALVERFLQHGTDIILTDDGKLHAYFPEPGVGRRPAEPDPWQQGFTDGAVRELWKIVQLVPGARDAVKEHVRLFPASRHPGGLVA